MRWKNEWGSRTACGKRVDWGAIAIGSVMQQSRSIILMNGTRCNEFLRQRIDHPEAKMTWLPVHAHRSRYGYVSIEPLLTYTLLPQADCQLEEDDYVQTR